MQMKENGKAGRRYRGLKIFLGAFLGIWALLLATMQIVLSTSLLTRMANRYAAELIDGDVSFGSISASVFRSFPNLNVSIEDFTLTYPHDRFASYDSTGIAHHLRDAGRGGTMDTLASFRKLSVALNYVAAARGVFSIPDGSVDGVRVFAHQYDSTTVNWDIFKISTSEDETEPSGMPHVIFRNLAITGNPYVAYTSPKDTVFASITMDRTEFDGKIDVTDLWKSKICFHIKDLNVEGRLPSDTLSFQLNSFGIDEEKDIYAVEAEARARIASDTFGRLDIPVSASFGVRFPNHDFNDISVRDLRAAIATLDITGEGDVRFGEDSTYVRAELSVNECPVEQTVREYLSGFVPEAAKLKTDARVTLTALCDGWWIPERQALPELIAEIMVPRSDVSFDGFSYRGRIAADVNASTDSYGKLGIVVNEFLADVAGVSLDATGAAEDLLCDDPLIEIDAKAKASLDVVNSFLPDGMEAEGTLDGRLSGMILLSDMSVYNFSRADLEGYVRSKGIRVSDRPDSIFAYIKDAEIKLGKAGDGAHINANLLGLKASVDSVYATIGSSMFVNAKGLSMTAQNARETISSEYGKEIHPIVGRIGANLISMNGSDSLTVGISSTSNDFKYSNRNDGGKTLPILALSSTNDRFDFSQGLNKGNISDARFSVSAVQQGARREARRKHVVDSLRKAHPGVHRDTLVGRMVRRHEVPYYISEDDFRKKDIDFRLSESLAKYVNDWRINGRLSIAEGEVSTPYFPLRNTLSDASGSFSNNEVDFSSLTIRSGESDLSVSGKISGLRRALTRNGVLDMDFGVTSERINTNELLAAYTAGSRYFGQPLDSVPAVQDSSYSLIVIPANINASLKLEGHEIDYSHLVIDWFESDIRMKERTLQVTNTVATSNMGDIYVEGFYSTKTKKDISAAFDLNMVDITADKVVTLFPAVDSLFPLLKSFKGMLDCEMAATTQIDTNMNFIPSSINGVIKIGGRDLSIEEDGGLRKLAKLLMFKDKRVGRIDEMSVQGLISDNTLEVFPFVLNVDRYTLAMNGIQNFDQSFRYHVSVLKSPVPFRFGINLFGDFDDWKYKLGKAKYKDVNVPVFTTEIKDVQRNLVGSIHSIFERGVEHAIRENATMITAVDEAKAASGYDGEADDGELDREEMASYEQMLNSEEEEEENVQL